MITRCPKCTTGLLTYGDALDELKCVNCSKIIFLSNTPSTNGSIQNQKKAEILTKHEKGILIDALTEQYLRTKGNIKRSRLDMTRVVNEERAKELEELIRKVEGL